MSYKYKSEFDFQISIIFFLLFVLVFAFFFFLKLMGGAGSHYSDGTRVGTLTKFSHKGLIFKSWEGQLVLGGVATNSDGNAVANTFDFSATDEDVIKNLNDALNQEKRVKVTYHQYLIKPLQIESDYVIDKIEVVK